MASRRLKLRRKHLGVHGDHPYIKEIRVAVSLMPAQRISPKVLLFKS